MTIATQKFYITAHRQWFFFIAALALLTISSVLFFIESALAATAQEQQFPSTPVSVRVNEIQAVNDTQTVNTLNPSADGTYVVYRDRFLGFQPVQAVMGYYNKQVQIDFSGQTLPGALVTVQLDAATARTHAAYADANGVWSMTIDANTLPVGNYNATMRASVDEVVSNTQIIGTFSVYTNNKLSNMTWVSVIIAGLGIIIVLTIVNGVMLFRRG